MHLKLSVQVTEPKGFDFQPETLEMWVGGTVDVEGVPCIEILCQTVQQLEPKRKLIDEETFHLPVSQMQSMVSGFDLETKEPIINMEMLNAFLVANYKLQIITE